MMKTKIEQFICSWALCINIAEVIPMDGAIESILKTIVSYLEKSKIRLNENNFQDLIHFALQTIQILPKEMRFKRLSYLNGGIQREILRLEYRQLKQQLIRYLQPIPWSSYGLFMAAEVIPAISLVLIIASMPGLVVAAKRTESSALAPTDPLCTHILQIDYAQSHLMLQDIKLQLSQMGVDYNKLPIQVDFSVEKIRRHADCFAKTLTQFCTGQLDSIEEASLLNALANEEAYLEPLHLIVTYAQNKALRYKIIAKLAQMLYRDIHSTKAANAHRLIRILGQAIMAIDPHELPRSVLEAIPSMLDILSLYKRIAHNKAFVEAQILRLRASLEYKQEDTAAVLLAPKDDVSFMDLFKGITLFAAVIGIIYYFIQIFNRTTPVVELSNSRIVKLKQNPITVKPLFNKPAAILSSPPQVINKKLPAQYDLHTILSKLNDYFSDLIIPNPDPLRWDRLSETEALLILRAEQYCFDTQGDGKVFWLSKSALYKLIKQYCENSLGAVEQSIRLIAEGVVLEQALALSFSLTTRSVKQYHAAFLKILKQAAYVYYPLNVQLDYYHEEFLVVFNRDAATNNRVRSYLSVEDFVDCAHRCLSAEVKNHSISFSISYETLKQNRLHNEKTFLAMKEALCLSKEKKIPVQPRFFYQRTDEAGLHRASAMHSRTSNKL